MGKFIALFLVLMLSLAQTVLPLTQGDEPKVTAVRETVDRLLEREPRDRDFYEGEKSAYTWSASDEYRLEDTAVLEKQKGKDFKILNLADIHFSDYGYRLLSSVEAEATIRRLVAQVQPDLIVLSGDNVCTDDTYHSIRRIVELMESFGVPWAPIYGNHDDEGNCDLDHLADVMMSGGHCLMQKGDPEMGVGNYIVNIVEDGAVVGSLIFMDSHHSQPNETQKQWFAWAAEGVRAVSGGRAEVSLFMHIPLPEYRYAYDEAWDAEQGTWRGGYGAQGELHETICCERDGNGDPVQRGFFDAIEESGNTKYVFCGHDHMNDFSIEYRGVRLTYMLKLGFASGYHPGFNGGTQIVVGGAGVSRITHLAVNGALFKSIVDIKTGKEPENGTPRP